MTKLNFEFDVRLPEVLVQQMMDGQVTAAMLLTMVVLYKWSTWGTGKVRRVCSASLCYATSEAYSERTFRECLRKLEWMRWITRHMTAGSHKWYPVTLHNYKTTDDAGKVHIINPTEIKVYDTFPEGRCHEASQETSQEASHEGSQEASQETSQRLLSLPESEPDSEPKPLPESELKSKGKTINQSTNQFSGNHSDEKETLKPQGFPATPRQEQNQPQTLNGDAAGVEDCEMSSGTWISESDALEHMAKCWVAYRTASPTVRELEQFMDIMTTCDNNTCFPDDVMEYARTHIKPKPKDGAKLWGALQSVKGLWNATCGKNVSTTNGLLAQFKDHARDPKSCGTCLKLVQGVMCAICGKNWVELGYDGKPAKYCKQCAAFSPSELAQRNAKPGSNAALNPDNHTGLDARGESWVADAMSFCRKCSRLHAKNKACESSGAAPARRDEGEKCVACGRFHTRNEDGVCDSCRKGTAA